jgi:hypothetical protein
MVRTRGWRRWLVHLLAGTTAVLGLATLAAPASAADTGLLDPCSYRSGFGGSYYCRVNIEDVTSTRYGTGKRVYLQDAFVSGITPSTVTVSQTRYSNDCTPTPDSPWCGATVTITFVDLTVAWKGGHRPALGTKLRLYGTTIPASMTPAGYVRTGSCTKELAQAELC